MSARESKVCPSSRSLTLKAGADGAAPGREARPRRGEGKRGRSAKHPHSIIRAMTDLERELRRVVEGEVRFDQYSRLLYSTDASMYQVEPIGVVLPRYAGRRPGGRSRSPTGYNVPVLPRGGGTILIGQTVNQAVVLDFSTLHEPGAGGEPRGAVGAGAARRGPGRAEPPRAADGPPLRARHLDLEPRHASAACSATTPAAPTRSPTGTTDRPRASSSSALLADGSRGRASGGHAGASFEAKCRAAGLEGQIYREVRADPRPVRATRSARGTRSTGGASAGYNLDELVKRQPLGHGTASSVGSEGTLVTVVEAKMRLVRRPKSTALDVIHYHDIQEALESSQAILETGPYAVEVTDKMILDLAREQHRAGAADGVRPGRSRGHHDRRVRRRHRGRGARQGRGAGGAPRARAASATPPTSPTIPPSSSRSGSSARRGSASSSGTKGDAKPIAFVEDTAVDPQAPARVRAALPRDPGQARRRRRLLRPLLGRLPAHPAADQPEDASAASSRCGPSPRRSPTSCWSSAARSPSEHGDGRARSPFLERVFGPQLFHAFRQLKRAFDPKNLMNPGNIVDAPRRHRAPPLRRRATRRGSPKTLLDFSAQGGFAARRRDVQRRRRLPQEARGDDVPLVHGHARRGALDARARQRAARGAVGQGAARPSSPASGSTR